jgi:hypothetical protein
MGTPEESQAKARSKVKPDTPSTMKYSYMFEDNKSPTVQLDALLRAISTYIVRLPSLRFYGALRRYSSCHRLTLRLSYL